jgi:Ca-activated chloride channel family protein
MTRTHSLLLSAAALIVVALVAPKSKAPAVPYYPPPVASPISSPPRAGMLLPILSGGPLGITATLSQDRVLVGDSQLYARVDVMAASSVETASRRPLDLAIAIDHSGSMQGEKMTQAKNAAVALIDKLQDGDHLSIVSFSTGVDTFPSTRIDSESRAQLRQFVWNLTADGSTNISGALVAARAELHPESERGIARIVLLSDGQPTMGMTSPAQLTGLVDDFRAASISTSAFGVGLDFNGTLMSELANHGGGSYAFIDNVERTGVALNNELNAIQRTVARQVSLRLALPGSVTLADVPGHAFSQSGNVVSVPLYDFTPGQTAQVVFKLNVTGVSQGDEVKLGVLTADCFDVLQQRQTQSAAVPLSAEPTPDPEVVKASEHADVLDLSRKLDLNVRLAEATRAYESGDSTKAIGLLDNIRSLFGASADALAGDDLVAVRSNWQRGGDDGSRANKNLTMKTMKNFGQNNVSQY